MSDQLRKRIFAELDARVLIDPHTHIDPHAPAAQSLADILGYHYYTELVHSAGLPRETIENPELTAKDKVRTLVEGLGPLHNTVQFHWLVDLSQSLFGFSGNHITIDNWEDLFDSSVEKMAQPDWADQVLKASRLEAVFLTNDFDDPLDGFDTQVYIPCLRTDDLVFHLADPSVRGRLGTASSVDVHDPASLRRAIGQLFGHFTERNAKACAISLPPDFTPNRVSAVEAEAALRHVLQAGPTRVPAGDPEERNVVAKFVFWTIAEFCAEFRLPFDLMIGVNRRVYIDGVYQGQDLFDSRVSLIQYRELFNAFPQVTFPISVLASVTNQELVSYAWIFPNVISNGHWWYSNTPTFIEHDASARLEAIPRTKQIGYYSDMYKLEFALPKFRMYKKILAKILAERFVVDRGWNEEDAVELGQQVLRGNVERVFGMGGE